jgi:hypothetical protein
MTIRNLFAATMLGGSLLAALAVQPTPLYAADCLASPKGAAPKGSHWFYRVDRATKKNCWYVRAETARPAAAKPSLTQNAPAPDAPLQPSIANARAEAGAAAAVQPKPHVPEPAPMQVADEVQDTDTAPAPEDGQSTLASRWLDRPTLDRTSNAAQTSAEANATSNPSTPAATAAPAAMVTSPASSAGVPALLLVIVGALGAAATVAGVLFKFGRPSRDEAPDLRREPQAPWDSADVGPEVVSPPLASPSPAPEPAAVREQHDAVIPDEIMQLLSSLSKEAPA